MFAISVHSFCTLTIFAEGLGEMMSACKARALDEGGMMKTSCAQSWYYDEFFTSLLRPIWNFRRAWKFNAGVIRNHPRAGNSLRESKLEVKPPQNQPKIEKMRKSRKTAENFRIHQFCTFKYAFSLCWRSKSFKMRSGFASPSAFNDLLRQQKGRCFMYFK